MESTKPPLRARTRTRRSRRVLSTPKKVAFEGLGCARARKWSPPTGELCSIGLITARDSPFCTHLRTAVYHFATSQPSTRLTPPRDYTCCCSKLRLWPPCGALKGLTYVTKSCPPRTMGGLHDGAYHGQIHYCSPFSRSEFEPKPAARALVGYNTTSMKVVLLPGLL